MTPLSTHTRPALSRSRIAETALALVDRDGLDALSMRKLGAELGVEGMAIYRYFPNKAARLAIALRAERRGPDLPLCDANDV